MNTTNTQKDSNVEYRINFNESNFNNMIKSGNILDANQGYLYPIELFGINNSTNQAIITYENTPSVNDSTNKFYTTIISEEIKGFYVTVSSFIEKYQSDTLVTNTYSNGNTTKSINWLKCNKECYSTFKKLFDTEREKTFIWIILILNYLIHPRTLHYEIRLTIMGNNIERLNGIWANDKQYFNLKYYKVSLKAEEDEQYKKSFRLVAYGPSASGKSFLGTTLINLMYDLDNTKKYLTKSFISIDGGKDREYSLIYRLINARLADKNSTDATPARINLADVTVSIRKIISKLFGRKELFEKYKSDITEFFISRISESKIKLNFYIPTTYFDKKYALSTGVNTVVNNPDTSSLVRTSSLSNKQKGGSTLDTFEFDETFNCNIYQCFDKCIYHEYPDYQCTTTLNSGIKRSLAEGKKYSGKSYNPSYKTGLSIVKKSNGLHIHNCGRSNGTSIIIDYNTYNPLISSDYEFKNSDELLVSQESGLEYDIRYNEINIRYVINKPLIDNGIYLGIKEDTKLQQRRMTMSMKKKRTTNKTQKEERPSLNPFNEEISSSNNENNEYLNISGNENETSLNPSKKPSNNEKGNETEYEGNETEYEGNETEYEGNDEENINITLVGGNKTLKKKMNSCNKKYTRKLSKKQ
jgi:hypothetical protein